MAGKGEALVSWTAPATDGGSPVLHYTVTSAPGGISATSTATTVTVEGLTNGTPYTFTVTATNITGTSASSTPSSAATPFASVAGLTAYPFMRLHRDSNDYSGTETWDGAGDGAVGVIVGIDEVRDGGGNPVALRLGSYTAELQYDGTCINVLALRDGRDFPVATSTISNGAGLTQFSGTNAPGDQPDSVAAFALLRLVGDANAICNLEVVFTSVFDVDAAEISVTSTQVIGEFRRGNARQDEIQSIADALFGAQYLAGMRAGCVAITPPGGSGDTTCTSPVNMAGVKTDGVFDIASIADVLFIAQRLAAILDDGFQ